MVMARAHRPRAPTQDASSAWSAANTDTSIPPIALGSLRTVIIVIVIIIVIIIIVVIAGVHTLCIGRMLAS